MEKIPQGEYTFSPQEGTIGHCYAAQVWYPDGTNMVIVESTEDQETATAIAKIIADTFNEKFNNAQEECIQCHLNYFKCVCKSQGRK